MTTRQKVNFFLEDTLMANKQMRCSGSLIKEEIQNQTQGDLTSTQREPIKSQTHVGENGRSWNVGTLLAGMYTGTHHPDPKTYYKCTNRMSDIVQNSSEVPHKTKSVIRV